MSVIRPLEPDDLPSLAGIFQRTFGKVGGASNPKLVAYLRGHYLEAPGRDPEIAPLVHVGDDGTITGFIGVTSAPMLFGDRPIRAAVCGALMVDDPAGDPMAGARLLRAFVEGPQDLSLSETANETSVALWTRLKGVVLPTYSMDWVRIFRPAGFLLDRARSRLPILGAAMPATGLVDRLLARRGGDGPRWSRLPVLPAALAAVEVAEIDAVGFAEAFTTLTAPMPLRPAYGADQLAHVIGEAIAQTRHGPGAFRAIRTRGGKRIGAFLFHMRPGSVAHVMQILAAPGQTGAVIDRMFAHLAEIGAVGAMGRSQPGLIEAMIGRRCAFLPFVTSVAHARDPALIAAFGRGEAVFNGLVGETWSRLVDDDFG